MKDLSRHIEYMLWESDVVVVPGLGVFISEDMPARYSAEEKLFIPPYRTLHFNHDRNQSDDALAECLIQLHQVTRSVADSWIEEFVNGTEAILNEEGEMDLGTIGFLSINHHNGDISFTPCESGVTTPSLFGLDTFQMSILPDTAIRRTQKRHSEASGDITFSISHRTLRICSSIAAVLAIVAIILIPVGTHLPSEFDTARFNPLQLFQGWSAPVVKPAVIAKPVKQNEKVKAPVVKEEVAVATVVTAEDSLAMEIVGQPQAQYVIVMASATTHSNADSYVELLHAQGYEHAVKLVNGKMVRVVIEGYTSQEEATDSLRNLRYTDPQFAQSWVMQLQ